MIAAGRDVGSEGDGGRQKLDGEVAEREGKGAGRFGVEMLEHVGFGVDADGAAELAEVVGEESVELRGVLANGGVEEAFFEALEVGGEVHGWDESTRHCPDVEAGKARWWRRGKGRREAGCDGVLAALPDKLEDERPYSAEITETEKRPICVIRILSGIAAVRDEIKARYIGFIFETVISEMIVIDP